MAARLTPWEVAFGQERFDTGIFPSIRNEAEARGVNTASRQRFLMLGAVGDLLHQLRPDTGDMSPGGDLPLPPPDAVRQYGALLFHAYRFWLGGRRLFTIEAPLVRELIARDTIGAWTFSAPNDAGYLQLPRHLIWARIDDEAPAEAVDGFFWSVEQTTAHDGSGGRLDLLLALGMHPGRPGFSVIESAAPLPAPGPGHWGDADARPGARDFANVLPGGELRELLAIVSTAELLKIVSRIFHYIGTAPEALQPAPAAVEDEEAGAHALPPSALPSMEIVALRTEP